MFEHIVEISDFTHREFKRKTAVDNESIKKIRKRDENCRKITEPADLTRKLAKPKL
jgi:hypothetical protein